MSFPLSPTQFNHERPNPDNPQDIAASITRLSEFPIYRAFTIVRTVTAAYTVLAEEDRIILANATGGAFNVTLPAAANSDAVFYGVKKIDATGNTVTVVTPGAETIDGAVNHVLSIQYQSIFILSDGSDYWII